MFKLLMNKEKVNSVTLGLINYSAMFSCEPMPDDMYEISVKPEAEMLLKSLMRYSEDLGQEMS